jgi:hypothetical protein
MSNATLNAGIVGFFVGFLLCAFLFRKEATSQKEATEVAITQVQQETQILKDELITVVAEDEKEAQYLSTLNTDSLIAYIERAGRPAH